MNNFIKGTCNKMCPISEIEMRTKQNLLHYYEIMDSNTMIKQPNHNKMVKVFSRSAAGTKTPKSADLRTPVALYLTVEYLLNEIVTDRRKPYNFVYDFVFDRFRAVRQEIVMQNLPPLYIIKLLEPMVLFLIYSYYRLSQFSFNIFDPKICQQHTQECLKKILCCYDLCHRTNNYENVPNRCVIESIYLLFNLGDPESLHRALTAPKYIKENLIVKTSSRISLEYFRGNYYKSLQMMNDLPHILHCVAASKVVLLQREILLSFTLAFNSKTLSVSLKWLANVLCYDSISDLKADCILYGLKLTDNGVIFNKMEFKTDANIPSRKQSSIDDKLNDIHLPDLLLLKNI